MAAVQTTRRIPAGLLRGQRWKVLELQDRLNLAIALAQKAGGLLRDGFGRAKLVALKGPNDLVTNYDHLSESLLVEGIRHACPGDAVLAEEGGASGGGDSLWLVDPLDGTTNYAHGFPVFSVSIGYYERNRPQLGVVYDPMRDELFHAVAGQGAWLNKRRLSVSTTSSLSASLLVTGFPYDIHDKPDTNLGAFSTFVLSVQEVRCVGSAALDLASVAAGRMDGYWELESGPWDRAAGMLLVQEAGGRVSRVDGGDCLPPERSSILASNGHIHDAMLEILSRQAMRNRAAPAAGSSGVA
jgi:myo-inositol-1(or 4)-monophosphatase